MSILKNMFLVIGCGLVLSGCATSKINKNVVDISSKISYAPTIDISYTEVSANIVENIGTQVRWGGKVIESEQLDESTTRLTVFAYPLSNEGRPVKTSTAIEEGGRFIVDLTDGFVQDENFRDHYVTFYGDVASGLAVINGNHQKTIPIVNAEELVDWNMVDAKRSYVNDDRRGNAFYLLSYRNGHSLYGSRSPFYGRSIFTTRSRFSSFGYFSRRNSFSRIGLSPLIRY